MISFAEFTSVVHAGREPYPWLTDFTDQTLDLGPPDLVAVPTGCGKTSVIDALVWILAAEADLPASKRKVGSRIVWAIDRRLLVDEVHEHASNLASRLQGALSHTDDPLHELASRLQSRKHSDGARDGFGLGDQPLVATRWRGGLNMRVEVRHPLQPEIITSTVAQIGSRLLFRGYGVGSRSLTLAAATAACDTTICLDEAHLVEPFSQTVAAISERVRSSEIVATPPLSVVRLSATSAADGHRRLELGEADMSRLSDVLNAPKHVRLADDVESKDQAQIRALVAETAAHLESGARTVACVCNSVRVAQSVYDALERLSKKRGFDVMLLVGPQRPIDRLRALDSPLSGIEAEPAINPPTRREVLFDGAEAAVPLILVGTQAVEVGLDIDVETMVTQSASAVALAQRFGRLNRRGVPGREGRATVVRQTGFPLYEDDEAGAWEWLQGLPPSSENGHHDISVRSLLESPPPSSRVVDRAPELTETVIELLRCTSPRPHVLADPDVEVYLKGIKSEAASDVSVCWRADLYPERASEEADIYRVALMGLAPPSPGEQLSLSVSAARSLIRGRVLATDGQSGSSALARQVTDVPDVEGIGAQEARSSALESEEPGAQRRFWILRFDGLAEGCLQRAFSEDGRVPLSELRPGDLVVMPVELGGVGEQGLAPSASRGTDVASDISPIDDVVPPVRLTRRALSEGLRRADDPPEDVERRVEEIMAAASRLDADVRLEAGDRASEQSMDGLVDRLAGHPARGLLDGAEVLELVRLGPRTASDEAEAISDAHRQEDQGDRFVSPASPAHEDEDARGRMPIHGWILVPRSGQQSFAGDQLRLGPPPTLRAHCEAVADRVGAFAGAAGLAEDEAAVLRLAASTHDLGKADPRMQAFFRGGVGSPIAEPIAKSVFGTADRRAEATARKASGLPRGFRHEQSTVEIVASAIAGGQLDGLSKPHLDLLLHVVSAHHGRSHPIPPVAAEALSARSFSAEHAGVGGTAHGDAEDGWQDGEPLRRFARLADRYGAWGLAYLEALLVLADRSVSAEGH